MATNTNALFGFVDDGSKIKVPAARKDEEKSFTKDFVARRLGIRRKEKKLKLYEKALKKPEDYIKEKREDLEKNVTPLTTQVFENEFLRLQNLGYSQEEATEKALKVAEEEKKRQMKIHEDRYPTTYEKVATRRLLKK